MIDLTVQTDKFSFVGGNLCLDFTNTSSYDATDPSAGERLATYEDLVLWGVAVGAVSGEEARSLIETANSKPQQAEDTIRAARGIRDAIHDVFAAAATGRKPKASDLSVMNRALAQAMSHARIRADEAGFAWAWVENGEDLDRALWPVVRAAADLLTSEELERVKQCGGDDCGWLFLDMSRNHSRHWCDMRDCGNRAKARSFYKRKRAGD